MEGKSRESHLAKELNKRWCLSCLCFDFARQNASVCPSPFCRIMAGAEAANLAKASLSLSFLIRDIVQFRGKIVFDSTKPEGVVQKLLDSSKINALGWRPSVSIEEGIAKTYDWFVHNFI